MNRPQVKETTPRTWAWAHDPLPRLRQGNIVSFHQTAPWQASGEDGHNPSVSPSHSFSKAHQDCSCVVNMKRRMYA